MHATLFHRRNSDIPGNQSENNAVNSSSISVSSGAISVCSKFDDNDDGDSASDESRDADDSSNNESIISADESPQVIVSLVFNTVPLPALANPLNQPAGNAGDTRSSAATAASERDEALAKNSSSVSELGQFQPVIAKASSAGLSHAVSVRTWLGSSLGSWGWLCTFKTAENAQFFSDITQVCSINFPR
mgnify:CR=1 FL=1